MYRLLVPALLCLSCYSPDIPSGKFACTQDADCPDPLVCRPMGSKGSRCVSPAPPACSGEGVMLSATVWGCRGAFAMGGSSGLCTKPGWHPCDTKDASKLGLGSACESAMGFFASRVPVEHVSESGGGEPGSRPYDVDCDIHFTVAMPYGLIGCGTEDGARRIGNKSGNCPGLSTALACSASSRWSCAAEGLDRASYDGRGSGGVLCCSD